ncbi:MAG TPA: kynureninase [Vicinamibacteria bacterium]|nr:kynureninase [Vicinamibacteria bacterium]
MTLDRSEFELWDRDDSLRSFRDEFELPEGVIYLDGNSLGALPARTPIRLRELIDAEWGEGLVRSWNSHGWIHYPRRVGDLIAKLVGAEPGEVVAADSTSINLFKLVTAACRLNRDRPAIVSERQNFPTDLYILQGILDFSETVRELRVVDRSELPDAIDDDVAALVLTQVDFRTGAMHDMRDLTARAHEKGVLTIWDLSHSAGAFPIHLGDDGIDFAVGCGYKYLNGGPGAPAFLFVARRHQEASRNALSGWMGHETPFSFDVDYRPASGIERYLCGTPTILGMAALEVGVEMLTRADLVEVRSKSRRLGDALLELVDAGLSGLGLGTACPLDSSQRGSQVSLRHEAGYSIVQALIARGVIGDFRAPDILRFGLTPFYLRYVDIFDAVEILKEVLETEVFRRPEFQKRMLVT